MLPWLGCGARRPGLSEGAGEEAGLFSGGSLRGQNSLYPLAKHSLGAALGFGGFKWSRSDGGVAPVCHPYVSPRSFLACRTRLHTDVDNRVCVHFLLDISFLFKLIIYLFPAVPSLCFVCRLPAGAAGRLPSSAVRWVRGVSGSVAVQASVAGALASSPRST